MKTITKYTWIVMTAIAITCNATAALILLEPPSPYKLTPENTDNIIEEASPYLDPDGLCDVISLLRLDNLALPPGGSLFSVTYTTSPGGNENDSADVTWNLSGTGFHLLGVYVFGGSQGANLYAADDPLTGSGSVHTPLTGDSGKFATISHLLFLGCATETNVPDGGATLALLGAAMGGMQFFRRKISA